VGDLCVVARRFASSAQTDAHVGLPGTNATVAFAAKAQQDHKSLSLMPQQQQSYLLHGVTCQHPKDNRDTCRHIKHMHNDWDW
jgi:hypothetical protein